MFDFNDPKSLALLMGAAGLLAPQDRRMGKGGQFFAALGKGMEGYGQGGLLGTANKRRDELASQETEIRRMQAEAMKRQAEEAQRQQAFRSAAFKPGVGAMPATQNDDNGFPMPSPNATFDPQAGAQVAPDLAYEFQQKFAKQAQKPMVVGKSLVNPETGQAIYQEQDKAPDWQNPEWVKIQMALRMAGRQPATQVTTNVLPPREVFKDSLGLKKDFDGQPEVKGFKEVQGAWDQISTALQKPSPANDLAAATKFMKLLDPGSVVRESELMMAMQASGALDRFTNTADRIIKGHKLTPEQRKDFYSAGEALYGASKDRYSQTVEQYSGIAKQYGLDDKFIQSAKPRSKSSSGWSIQRVP